ncbi:4-hydroxybenzoyl-CoA thioesterase [Paracoccus isoporae]|uniref:4-hydroxybenzoyl-CoA thioesterase n=2 Tax=Paracoccus isoporae TaxID=591205 RepID=A0A1G6V5K6_9RHOB|nr:4-hydroxybenzoyl-CoA thioesterase [Paracoccus isoporae]
MPDFRFPQKILFKHCDPAGIGFYPRYVEIINDAVEAMFDDLLGWPFAEIVATGGVPTASIHIEFEAPCRLGDHITLEITIDRVGDSSMTLQTEALSDSARRFHVRQVLVCIGEDGRPRRWPDHLRAKVDEIMEGRT